MKAPSYSAKFKKLASDPAGQKIRGCIIEIKGWPPINKVAAGLRPKYYNDSTIEAGKK